jgi:two-component system, chemotaxis family, response regulator Rcp1
MSEEISKYEILLVEDNPGDVRLTMELLKNHPYLENLQIVYDGEEAIRFLRKQDKYSETTTPNLVILDLNLPKKNGLEVLKEIKSDKELKHIPVIVLTSSEAETDIMNSYELYANCYITKPVDFQTFAKQFNILLDFWCRLARIPKNVEKKF